MPGERQLRVGREDPDVVAGFPDGGHERGLGEADLPGESLHQLGVESVRYVEDHAELVPGERGFREYVEQTERHAHGRAVSQGYRLLGSA